ncbi:MAG: class I tRNA ligase family protein, partial [Clostridia bacterium]|nr:class I tRNA ligase family protein [Clostridia bacterium]
IMISEWPKVNKDYIFEEESAEMERIMAAIRAIRNCRSEMNVPPSKKAHVYIATGYASTFQKSVSFMDRLASASGVEIGESFDLPGAVTIVSDGAKIYIPMDELVDKAKEIERLTREKTKTEKEIEIISKKLANESFVAKAPAAVVENERAKIAKYTEQLALINESLAALENK